ncbi:YdaS family helix-turn-helix protein [Acidovorax sp. SUPP2825]|uniref:transcriptional regulator n=1 Tax=Acidovorax sp. SUPP2825 TaxID=2920879 RepID=UPI0024E184FF|nr:YdaS family helix-turn-helix protein [Acidovorax sp. SUPP2825]
MLISEYLNAERGRAASLARGLGVKPVVISRWGSGSKPVPIERCIAIERLTGGLVGRKDLRPNDWQDVWPDLSASESVPATKGEVSHA